MGLFKCCIKQQVLLKDDFRRISEEDDPPPPPDKETKPYVELTADVLKQDAREVITSGQELDSGTSSEAVDQDKPCTRVQSQDALMSDASNNEASVSGTSVNDVPVSDKASNEAAPEDALVGCLSARDVRRLHSGVHRCSMDAEAQSHTAEEHASKQEEIDRAVRKVFLEYARFGTRDKKAKTLDVYRFMKLIRECSLMTSPDSAAAVDLIFCKGRTLCAVSKTPTPDNSSSIQESMSERGGHASRYLISSKSEPVKGSRMGFEAFLCALHQIAELLGVPEPDVRCAVAASRGPLVNAVTLPRFVRLHDAAPPDATPPGSPARYLPAGEHVMERGPGTYAKGMIKSGPTHYGTSGFAPKASARPGSPCFATKSEDGRAVAVGQP